MFEVMKAPDHVLAFRVSGTMTVEDVNAYKLRIDGMLKKHDRIGICVDLSKLSDVTADALVEGTKADFALLRHRSDEPVRVHLGQGVAARPERLSKADPSYTRSAGLFTRTSRRRHELGGSGPQRSA